jgi:hypothetical protein
LTVIPSRPGDPDQRGLAGDVREQVGRRRLPHRVRDHEHDPPEASLGHPRGECLGQPQRRLDVDRLDSAPAVEVEVSQRRAVERRRGVDEHVAASAPFEHVGCRAFHVVAAREIDRSIAGAVEHGDGVVGVVQGGGDRAADRAGAAGDDRDPTHGWRPRPCKRPETTRQPRPAGT